MFGRMKKTKKERKRKKDVRESLDIHERRFLKVQRKQTFFCFFVLLVYQAGGRTAFTLTVFVGFAAGLLAPHRKGEAFCAQSRNDDIRGGQRCGT